MVQAYLPTGGSGSILITSRDPGSLHSLGMKGCKIQSFETADGRDFLLSLLNASHKCTPGCVYEAESLASELGGLPLGIKQMGGFLRESGCSISGLIEILKDKEQNKQMLADETGFARLGYSHTLASVWKISLSRLDKHAFNLLGFFSFLDPDGIHEQIIKCLQNSYADLPDLFPSCPNTVKYISPPKLSSYRAELMMVKKKLSVYPSASQIWTD